MANHIIVIVGGASFEPGIKEFFNQYDFDVEHYNARKSSDLKKQTVPKNTIGTIITVDRSHMAFGNSNELTRYLKNNNIPFEFSSSNFASFNAAKLLFQKICKQFPDLVKTKVTIPESEQKLESSKNEWEKYGKIMFSSLQEWYDILSFWDKNFNEWEAILDDWKVDILEWKEIQKNKELKKKLNRNLKYLLEWKQEIHDYGILLESKLNILKEWKLNIEKSCNEIIENYENLEKIIIKISNLNDKSMKGLFREWKIDFSEWKEYLELWEKEFKDWYTIFPEPFEKMHEWEKEIKLWRANRKRNLE